MTGLFGEWSLELTLDHNLYCCNWNIPFAIDHKSIDVFNTRVLGNGNLMISDVKLQHAGVYVCRATIPGTRNFTVAMATLTVLGMFLLFCIQENLTFSHLLFYLTHSFSTFLEFHIIDMKVNKKFLNLMINFQRKLKSYVKI